MSQISFHEISLLWKAEKSRYVKVTTMAAYSLIIQNHLEPCFSDLDDVRQSSVQKYVDAKLAQGISVTTLKGHIIVLKMILRYGEKQGFISQRIIEVRFPTQRMKAQMRFCPSMRKRGCWPTFRSITAVTTWVFRSVCSPVLGSVRCARLDGAIGTSSQESSE